MTHGRAVAAGVVALALVGCQAGPAGTPPPTGSSRPPASAPVSASAGADREASLPRLVLTADLDEPPARWPLQAHIPFGPGPDQLGLIINRQRTSTPIYPPSFAVDQDGSLWILDIVKHRIAHFTSRGAFLGAAAGVRFNRHTPLPVDIAFAGTTLWLLSHRTPVAGVLQSVSAAGVQPARTVQIHHHHPAIVTTLLPSGGSGILGWVEGRASRDHAKFGTGPSGIADLEGPHGEVQFLPGYPLADGRFLRLTVPPTSDRDLELRSTAGGRSSIRPIRIRLQAGPEASPVPPIVQLEQDAGTAHGILAVASVGPARYRDRRGGSSRWLLGVFDDGSPLIWERLPIQSLDPEWATRTLTSTPEGAIYLMAAQPDGITIYRRARRA